MFSLFPITAEQVSPGVWSLFDPSKPTMPRAFNVLEGINRGHILVDDPIYPTVAVIREATYGTLYFCGEVNPSLLDALAQGFRQIGDVGIGCWLDDPINEMIPSMAEYDVRTLYFTKRSPLREKSIPLPTGYSVAVRNGDLLKQSFDYQSTVDAFGTEEDVLKHTVGIVILYEGKVVCEAATGAPTHGQIEIGVTTDRDHRQRGLASIACTELIRICEAKELNPWWDCAKQNLPSVRLARKLGFIHEREYRYIFWSGDHRSNGG